MRVSHNDERCRGAAFSNIGVDQLPHGNNAIALRGNVVVQGRGIDNELGGRPWYSLEYFIFDSSDDTKKASLLATIPVDVTMQSLLYSPVSRLFQTRSCNNDVGSSIGGAGRARDIAHTSWRRELGPCQAAEERSSREESCRRWKHLGNFSGRVVEWATDTRKRA